MPACTWNVATSRDLVLTSCGPTWPCGHVAALRVLLVLRAHSAAATTTRHTGAVAVLHNVPCGCPAGRAVPSVAWLCDAHASEIIATACRHLRVERGAGGGAGDMHAILYEIVRALLHGVRTLTSGPKTRIEYGVRAASATAAAAAAAARGPRCLQCERDDSLSDDLTLSGPGWASPHYEGTAAAGGGAVFTELQRYRACNAPPPDPSYTTVTAATLAAVALRSHIAAASVALTPSSRPASDVLPR